MNELLRRIKQNGIYLIPAIVAVVTALGLFGYLGTFSRYTSDDYCLSAFYFEDGGLVDNLVMYYTTTSSRYTNILFIGLVDKVFGWYNPAILPPLMIALLVYGLYLLLDQVQATARWGWSRWVSFYLAALIGFFSLVQAPDLYQTLYWRAGMTSHFAPIALLPFLCAFVMKQIRSAKERAPSLWIYVACFVIAFIMGGFSEPPTTLMISALILAILAVWWWVTTPVKRSTLLILLSTLAGFLVSLIVLALAPANSMRIGDTESNLLLLAWKIFYSTFEFAVDHMQTLPLPVLFSILIPGMFFYVQYAGSNETFSNVSQKQFVLLILVALSMGYILITASFAPSVYGQSFPAARARFAGVLLLTCTFMAAGALMGILAAKSGRFSLRFPALQAGLMLLFVLLSLYPLRTASRIAADIPLYQQRALAWDERDAQIRAMKADGIQELTIRFLSTDPVQDLGDRREFRLNRCASQMYGVNSILTLPGK